MIIKRGDQEQIYRRWATGRPINFEDSRLTEKYIIWVSRGLEDLIFNLVKP